MDVIPTVGGDLANPIRPTRSRILLDVRRIRQLAQGRSVCVLGLVDLAIAREAATCSSKFAGIHGLIIAVATELS